MSDISHTELAVVLYAHGRGAAGGHAGTGPRPATSSSSPASSHQLPPRYRSPRSCCSRTGGVAGPAFLPPPSRELLPESWPAALTVEQQQWIGRVLFTRDQWGRPSLITDLNLWWNPPPIPADLPPASRVPRPLLCMSAVSLDATPDLASAADMPSCTGSMLKAGLYRTIRRVLDINGWYLMATEYLSAVDARRRSVGGHRASSGRAPTYSCQFPAVLTYKLSCDQRVVTPCGSSTQTPGCGERSSTSACASSSWPCAA
ncbi:hypothetical protein KUCAC02_026836 [Chaenocephalus aceratus]|nr:hypothetical protein KUCAC02_026836 [Chaenocephalus aceratus]